MVVVSFEGSNRASAVRGVPFVPSNCIFFITEVRFSFTTDYTDLSNYYFSFLIYYWCDKIALVLNIIK